MECERPEKNASNEEIRAMLAGAQTIAVVGLSNKPHRDSYRVAAYMQDAGYRIFPVNPILQGPVLDEAPYADLDALPEAPDIVCIFRKPEAVPPVVDEAIAKGARAVWMQLGIAHNASAEKARAAGLQVVMNKCIKVEHAHLL